MDDLISASLAPPPGVAPRKWTRLTAFLGALPPAAAARLFSALERAPGEGLPSAALLRSLRIRLVAEGGAFPSRPKSAARSFFAPFEDFFIAGRRGRKRRARIDRASLGPIWTIIMSDGTLADAAAAARALDAAYASGDGDIAALEKRLYETAADGLSLLVTHAEDDAAFRADLSARLSGDEKTRAAALHDLAEIALLLPFVPHLTAAQKAFPRPVSALTEEDLFTARKLYARASEEACGTAGYLLSAIAARMDSPWRAMRLAYFLMRTPDEALAYAKEDASRVIDTLVEDVEALARGIEQDADNDPDTEEGPARLRHFAEFAGGLVAEAAREGDGVTMRRAEACRDIAAEALSRYAETALSALRRNQPVRHAGGSSRLKALRPDISRAVDRAAEKAARAGALLLASANELSERLARPDAAASIVRAAEEETRRYANDLVSEIRAAEGEERSSARRRMESVLRAAERLLPADDIALLKQRANVAAVSA